MKERVKVVDIRTDEDGDHVLIELSDGRVIMLTISEIEEAIRQNQPQ